MSALPTEINKSRPSLRPMEVLISGRIEEVQRYEGTYQTRVICPAADQFSQPQNVKIRSKQRLGSKEEMISVTCRLGGYKRKVFRATDKETGESVSVVPVDMTLDLVD
ncbi:MAG TPA: single-stranded DNA-binding protein [bacterium]|nr:single-stranded DNA-binding protein [bacterium]